MTSANGYSRAWTIAYKVYPPLVLRTLERFGFHSGRQAFYIGRLAPAHSIDDFKAHLTAAGFEPAILAWKDSDEILSMRRVHNKIYQWHIRLYEDRELRAHYEYSPEGNPWKHAVGSLFSADTSFFIELLRGHLAQET